jgi:DNA-binding CsgD family transcriptional regulator/pimeloyl-ACP methyl ester carboxylesterase
VLTYSDVGTFSARLPGGLEKVVQARGGPETLPREQVIGFLSHRGGHVAYAVTGSGPLLLVDLGRAHHLEAFWRHAPYRRFVQRLAAHFTVLRWDRPGFGLSDREPVDLSSEAELALVERVAGFVGADQLALLAADDAGPGMVRFAARHREVVSRLALFGTAAEGLRLALPLPSAALIALAKAPTPAIHAVVAAAMTVGCEPEVGRWLYSALQASADARTMARLILQAGQLDARGAARRVRSPALVLHRQADAVVESRWGRALAQGIPGAEFVALPGSAHLVYAGDADAVLAALLPFLDPSGEAKAPPQEAQLSSRELEVAQMVTLGLTNAEIGQRLAIRRRTVDAHLEHIRAKLGVHSRARVAAWAARHHRPSARGG